MEWNSARDSDYPGRVGDGYLTIDKEPYLLDKSQHTHGLVSHAIKHAKDTGMKDLPTVLNQVKSVYNDIAVNGELYHVSDMGAVVAKVDDVNNISEKALRNSLDYISDKVMNDEDVSEEEQRVLEAFQPVVDDYHKAATLVIEDPDYNATSKADPNKEVFIKGHLVAIKYMNKLSTFMGLTRKNKPLTKFYKGDETPNQAQIDKVHKLLGESILRQYVRTLILERY